MNPSFQGKSCIHPRAIRFLDTGFFRGLGKMRGEEQDMCPFLYLAGCASGSWSYKAGDETPCQRDICLSMRVGNPLTECTNTGCHNNYVEAQRNTYRSHSATNQRG